MDLLDALRLYKKEIDKIEAQERKIPNPPEQKDWFTRLIISVILGLCISALIVPIIGKNFYNDNSIMWVVDKYGGLGELGMWSPGIIIYLFWTMKLNSKKKEIQRKIQIEYIKLEKIRLECQNNMKLIGVIPEYYHNGTAINLFIHYIESMQASTLQECIKLYNEEMRHRESVAAMDSISSNLDYLGSKINSMENEVYSANHK